MYIVEMQGQVAGVFRSKRGAEKYGKTLNMPWVIERRRWHSTDVFASWLYKKVRKANHKKYHKLLEKSKMAQRKVENFRVME